MRHVRPEPRLQWVDTAKGISIILVVMMYSVFNVGQDVEGIGAFHYVMGFATPFRMPEFFLISGLFLDQVIARNWRAYADRRVVHYFYFYAVWAVIHIVVKVGIASRDPARCSNISPGPWSSLMACCGSSICSPRSASWSNSPMNSRRRAGRYSLSARLPDGAYPDRLVPDRPVLRLFRLFLRRLHLRPDDLPDRRLGHGAQGAGALVLAAYAIVNGLLVFSPGYAVLPNEIHPGLAALPGIRLTLALAGSLALCVTAAFLSGSRLQLAGWLGERSLVVYLVFVLPMSFAASP